MMGNRSVQQRAMGSALQWKDFYLEVSGPGSSRLCETLDKSLYLSEPQLPGRPCRDTLCLEWRDNLINSVM